MLVFESKRLMWHSCFKTVCNYNLISVARLTAGFRVQLVQLCFSYHCLVLLPVSLFSCYCLGVEISNSYHQVACNCSFHSYGLHYRFRCSVWYLLHAGSLRYYHFLVQTYYFLPPSASSLCYEGRVPGAKTSRFGCCIYWIFFDIAVLKLLA